jgi:hypothetical protein
MDKALNAILAVVSGIIGLAIVSVIFSKRAQTGEVITATGSALAGVIQAATNPYTGQPNAFSNAGGLASGTFGAGNSGGSHFDVGDALDIASKVAPYFV